MSRPSANRPADAAVIAFLTDHHGSDVTDLEPLDGGYWSAAYGYEVDGEQLVLRLGGAPGGFRSDRDAMRYSSDALPIPDVLSIGQGLGRWFAVSRRHHGRFLEHVGPEHSEALAPTVVGLLAALRAVPDHDAPATPWHSWLLAGITDRPGAHTSGWRAIIADHPDIERTFRACDDRIRSHLDACPDLRDLVHGDLLHGNVLVSPETDKVTAVFSWKCSTWGDSLYDLAWCTFWGRFHLGIGALGLWNRVVPTLPPADRIDAAVRHHVYELHIGASHLGWYASLGDDVNLAWTARHLDELIEAGPHT